jgi:hypothetical protein
LERAVTGGGLMIAFNDMGGDGASKSAVGHLLRETLEQAGLACEWNGDPERRIGIPGFDWKRRFVTG